MDNEKYRRNVEELRKVAAMFWSEELAQQEAEISVIPTLIETQDDFISILSVPVSGIEGVFGVVNASNMPGNLFLKHLAVLSDVGGEYLQRVNKQFERLFPSGSFEYLWGEDKRIYEFKELPVTSLSNNRLGIDGKRLFQAQNLTALHEDVAAILLLGSNALNEETATVLSKCEISNYLGKPNDLDKYVGLSLRTMG